jgi:hypothetical protein
MKRNVASIVIALSVLGAAGADAQERASSSSLSLLAGGINSEAFASAGRNYPLVALRADWRHTPYILSEIGISHAVPVVVLEDHGPPTPSMVQVRSHVTSATVGLQAQLPLAPVRPYVGVATGLHMRLDPSGGHRFVSLVQHFPVGVGIDVTERMGLRGEARIRFDEQQGNGFEAGGELSAGITWRR